MTLRLGGSERTSLRAIASLSIVAALACGVTAAGCSSNSGSGGPPTSTADAGDGGDGTVTQLPDSGEAGPVVGQCTTPTFMPQPFAPPK